jgi:UDP-N-acetylmuramoylalanine--D-glutamate ligase
MKLLIIGAAASGRAAAALALARGHEVSIYDRSPQAVEGLDGFRATAGEWNAALLDGVDLVVTSPGVPEHAAPLSDAATAGTTVWSELEFGCRHLTVPYVAVTGTNGKTTVTATAAAMLVESGIGAAAAGNIGTPVSSIVDDAVEVVVIEASSFQLRYIEAFRPMAAAILNVAPDHLDWHGSTASYAAAKKRIYENMGASDVLAYDVDDAGAVELAAGAVASLVPVSGKTAPSGGAGTDGSELIVGDLRFPLPTSDPSYVADLAFAAVLAIEAGASRDGVDHALAAFAPGPHRREIVGSWGGITWIDDSKATNPHAARAAAASYPSVVLIGGGRNKGLDLEDLAPPTVRHLVAYGEAGGEMAASNSVPSTVVESFDDAVALAGRLAKPGDVVLLAPGCASFDQFSSYAERGERFAALARHAAKAAK